MTADEKIELELIAALSRAVEDEMTPPSIRKARLAKARNDLRAFYGRLFGASEVYFKFDDVTKELVPFEPAPSLRVRQDGWGYRG